MINSLIDQKLKRTAKESAMRAGAIVMQNNQVALIKRQREDESPFYLFPGGTVEPGETPGEAAKREILEELGLHIKVGALVVVSRFRNTEQYFYRSTITSGDFGTGTGQEIIGEIGPNRGIYQPIWMPVDDLLHRPTRPQSVCQLIVKAVTGTWPDEPLYVTD
jgi:8-oxo-dGTP diphosphatase